MALWLSIIFLMGLLLSFGSGFLEQNNLTRWVGIIITLICVGIGIRTESLRRKGTREKLAQRVKELEGQGEAKGPEDKEPEKQDQGSPEK